MISHFDHEDLFRYLPPLTCSNSSRPPPPSPSHHVLFPALLRLSRSFSCPLELSIRLVSDLRFFPLDFLRHSSQLLERTTLFPPGSLVAHPCYPPLSRPQTNYPPRVPTPHTPLTRPPTPPLIIFVVIVAEDFWLVLAPTNAMSFP